MMLSIEAANFLSSNKEHKRCASIYH